MSAYENAIGLVSRRRALVTISAAAGASLFSRTGSAQVEQKPAIPAPAPLPIRRATRPGAHTVHVLTDPDFHHRRSGVQPSPPEATRRSSAYGPAHCGPKARRGAAGPLLVWSDIPNNRQLRWLEDDGRVTVFRSPSNNSNGNTFDFQGRQLSASTDAPRRALRARRLRHDHCRLVQGQAAQLAERRRAASRRELLVHRPDPGGRVVRGAA